MRPLRTTILGVSAWTALYLLSGCGRDPGTAPGKGDPSGTSIASNSVSVGELSRTRGAALLADLNRELARRGLKIAIAKAEFLVKDGFQERGRTLYASDRFERIGERWVPGDARRLAEGHALTYLVLRDRGVASPGIPVSETEAAIDRAFATWATSSQCAPLDLVKRPDTGADATIVDYIFGMGDLGDPFLADIVDAGFWPGELFERMLPGGSTFILGVTFTLIFVDDWGYPTDLDRNRLYDTALAEVYLNNEFLWSTIGTGVDIETVALHENGHALGLGHFGNLFVTQGNGRLHASPRCVMNAAYIGPLREPQRNDRAALCGLYAVWP